MRILLKSCSIIDILKGHRQRQLEQRLLPYTDADWGPPIFPNSPIPKLPSAKEKDR